MSDRTLPWWFRVVLIVPAVGQTFFAFALLFDPASISDLWPWPMTPVAARILGASTLVSVPLAVLPALINRWSVTRIPLTMLLTYRVFQITAGLIHIDRFDFSHFPTWNYFAGGSALLIIYAYVLLRGNQLGKPVTELPRFLPGTTPLQMPLVARVALIGAAVVYFVLGLVFLNLGPNAAPLWFEAEGQLTPLTARLFSSPMIGLALSFWLVAYARWWHEVIVPGIGMTTFGVAGAAAMLAERANIDPPSAAGYLTAALPLVLLAIGLFLVTALLWSRRPVPSQAS
jgi:hypothetical protein